MYALGLVTRLSLVWMTKGPVVNVCMNVAPSDKNAAVHACVYIYVPTYHFVVL